jgi:hypothetical protein
MQEMKAVPSDSEVVPRAVILWCTDAEGRERRRSAENRVETQPVPG